MRRHIKRYRRSSFKQGIYSPVNRKKYASISSPKYRSSWELKFFQWCDKNINVLEWSSESVIVPYVIPKDGKVHRYYIDGAIALRENEQIVRYLVEIKPYKQTIPPVESKRKKASTILYEKVTYAVNKAKWSAATAYATKRGMNFIILTENELNIR